MTIEKRISVRGLLTVPALLVACGEAPMATEANDEPRRLPAEPLTAATCRYSEHAEPVELSTALSGEDLWILARNPGQTAGDVHLEVVVQTPRGQLPAAHAIAHVTAHGTAEVRVPIAELGLLSGDSAAQVSVLARVAYDDGEADAGHASGISIERVDAGWQEQPESTVDHSAMVAREATLDAERAVVTRLPFGKADVTARLRAEAVDTSRAILVNGTLDSEPEPTVVTLAGSLTVNFCFRQNSVFTDGGQGEDHWPETATVARPSAGMSYKLTPNVGSILTGFLNSSGCTGNLSVNPATWTAEIQSWGTLQSRWVYAKPCVGTNCTGATSVASRLVNVGSVSSSGTVTSTYSLQSTFDAFQVALLGLFAINQNPGNSGIDYDFRTAAPTSSYAHPNIWIGPGGSVRKWLIGHEMGHRFFHMNAPLVEWNNINLYDVADSDLDCNSPPDGSGNPTHNIRSKEYMGSAFTEAIASFYGAAAFNTAASGANCWFEGGVDCELGNGGFTLGWMETMCPLNMAGRGTEVDWLRAMWNVRTGGSSTASIATMLSWINVTGYTTTNTFTKLSGRATTIGGALLNNWNSTSATNRLDGVP